MDVTSHVERFFAKDDDFGDESLAETGTKGRTARQKIRRLDVVTTLCTGPEDVVRRRRDDVEAWTSSDVVLEMPVFDGIPIPSALDSQPFTAW